MSVVLTVVADGLNTNLRFHTSEDAERFKEFVTIYMLESGEGNHYGAYWIFNSAQKHDVNRLRDASVLIDRPMLSEMLGKILRARTAGAPPGTNVCQLVIITSVDGIGFSVEGLPPRLQPAIGDMYRVICPEEERSLEESNALEGRVRAVVGDFLEVTNWHDEAHASPGQKLPFHRVRAAKVMKINDWMEERRDRLQKKG